MPRVCGVKAVLKQPQSKRSAQFVGNGTHETIRLRAFYRRILLRLHVGHIQSTVVRQYVFVLIRVPSWLNPCSANNFPADA